MSITDYIYNFFFTGEYTTRAKINKLCVGESLVGEGNEIAHIDLIIGTRGSVAEYAFAAHLRRKS